MNYFIKKRLNLGELPTFHEIRLELTNHCGCHCFMCPRDTVMTRKKGYMTNETLNIILEKFSYINYPCQIHLHGQGEALLCKDLPQKIQIIKQYNKNLMPLIVTTLAYKLDPVWFESLFANGLSYVHVSLYAYNEENYQLVHGSKNFKYVLENLKLLAKFIKKYDIDVKINLDNFGDGYPIKDSVDIRNQKRNDFIIYLKEIGFSDNNIIYRDLHNYGNSNNKLPNYTNQYVPCSISTKGSRSKHISIDWEGNVIPCCFDMNSSIKWGNICTQSLEEIFNSKNRLKFLEKHLDGKYIHLCAGCIEYKNKTKQMQDEYEKLINPENNIFYIGNNDSRKIIKILGVKFSFKKGQKHSETLVAVERERERERERESNTSS